jgi:hypothetical protein
VKWQNQRSDPHFSEENVGLDYGAVRIGEGAYQMKLCPNCARQGQIFPNGSKRNQKSVKKLE